MSPSFQKPNTPRRRTIRSFVRRQGRMTPGQRRALDSLWPRYGRSSSEGHWRFPEKRCILEIGTGMGEHFIHYATAHPDTRCIAIEVYEPGVGHLLAQAEAAELENVTVFCEDALEVLDKSIEEESLDGVFLLFPDPWPKKRHHKRRIVQPAFAALVASKLKVGGQFHVATDWENYAEHMMIVLSDSPSLENLAGSGKYLPRTTRAALETRFEQRGKRLGHPVFDMIFVRI